MSRKTTYTMREYRELMRRAEDVDCWNKVHVTVYADDLPTCCGFEEWEIPVEDMADFIIENTSGRHFNESKFQRSLKLLDEQDGV